MRILTASTILLIVPFALAAQTPIQIDTAKVDAVFKDYGTTTPGCALGIYERGRVRFARGYGMADLSLGVPINPTTLFDIGSTSKQFTAASIHLLAQDGKLRLDDDIRKYLPEIPAYPKVITIRQLLHHTGGLRDYLELMGLQGSNFEDETGDQEALDVIARRTESSVGVVIASSKALVCSELQLS